jgi:glycosyltransferase involved in cell wall biosynthesis
MSKLETLNNPPKISIIIATCNCANDLEQTILSFIAQDYQYKELVIIDCASSDQTVELLEQYTQQIDYFISEPDKGISDAFNKGVKLATGDYINFQGAGDTFSANNVLTQMMRGIDKNMDLLICGQVEHVSNDRHKTRLWISDKISTFKKSSLLFKMSLPHQALFTHQKLFDQYGLFDVNNVYCMDYEHLLRYYSHFPRVIGKDILVTAWQAGGIGCGKTIEIYKEYDAIKRRHKVASGITLSLINQWNLFKYHTKTIIGHFKKYV